MHEAPMPCPRCHVGGGPTDLDEALPSMHHLTRPQSSRRGRKVRRTNWRKLAESVWRAYEQPKKGGDGWQEQRNALNAIGAAIRRVSR